MTEGLNDDIFDRQWFRYLVVAALLSGAGGGFSALTKDTSDRYKAAEAHADFAERDKRISRLEEELASHLEHSAKYTEKIDQLERDVERLNGGAKQ